MIGKLWKFTLFFVLCLVIALLFNLPIQQVLPHLRLPDTIRLAGVDGTVLRGEARQIVVQDFPFYDVDYRYLPSCIPLLKICYRVTYRQGTVQVAYDMLNGDTEVSGARLEYPVPELARYVPNLLVKPSGRLELHVEEMAIVGGKPSALSGKLIWRDLGIADDGIRLNIGDYQIDFNGDATQYAFKLSEIDGSLDVDGEGEVGADGQYRVDIRIVATDSIEPQVRNVLDLAAKKISYNNYRIDQSGRLPPRVRAQIFP
jgi:hypothetical protein